MTDNPRRRRWPAPAAVLACVIAALAALPAPPAAAGLLGDAAGLSAAFPRRAREVNEGEILVRFKSAVPGWQRDAFNAQEGNLKLRELPRSGAHLLRIPPTTPVEQAVGRYAASGLRGLKGRRRGGAHAPRPLVKTTTTPSSKDSKT